MKTYGNIWEKLITIENFYLAQRKSRLGKSTRKEIVEFEKNLGINLDNIRQQVIDGSFHTSEYESRTLFEPKERKIYILPYAPDRIVQHALMRAIVPIFEKIFINDSYACIEGKGQMRASQRTMKAVRRNTFCLKCDIRKFYPSINQNILSGMYHRTFREKKLLALIDDIVFSFPGGYNCPIGNYTSQWSGNFYLNPLDYFCKHE
ncbi:MAG: RNA-directed DNA polymerase, partial [Phocaeicola sp.]